MIASHTKGFAKLGIACQCIIVALCFWTWLAISQAGSGLLSLDLPRYAVYNTVLLLGIVFAYATATNAAWFTQLSFYVCHGNAVRQTAFAVGLLLLLLEGERDHTISRAFLFTFVPLLYVVLFVTQRTLPPLFQNRSSEAATGWV